MPVKNLKVETQRNGAKDERRGANLNASHFDFIKATSFEIFGFLGVFVSLRLCVGISSTRINRNCLA
jgi:hypothetical protein